MTFTWSNEALFKGVEGGFRGRDQREKGLQFLNIYYHEKHLNSIYKIIEVPGFEKWPLVCLCLPSLNQPETGTLSVPLPSLYSDNSVNQQVHRKPPV